MRRAVVAALLLIVVGGWLPWEGAAGFGPGSSADRLALPFAADGASADPSILTGSARFAAIPPPVRSLRWQGSTDSTARTAVRAVRSGSGAWRRSAGLSAARWECRFAIRRQSGLLTSWTTTAPPPDRV